VQGRILLVISYKKYNFYKTTPGQNSASATYPESRKKRVICKNE